MTDIRPFRGLRYARELEPRLAGPYDVISPEDRERLAREPENIVHLTLPPGPEGERDYESARGLLERWIAEGVLVRDTKECLYALEERTTDGRTRRGFLALVRLAAYDERIVLPHERTMRGPKVDRLQLTREVRANLEPVFFLYEDRQGGLASAVCADASPVLARASGPDGTGLTMRAIEDSAAIEAARAFLSERPVIIADGHHRYETMVAYRDECREQARAAGHTPDPEAPEEFLLVYLVNAFDPGSEVRAIHRLLHGNLGDVRGVLEAADFRIAPIEGTPSAVDLIADLRGRREGFHAFTIVHPDGSLWRATRPKTARLDVQILHEDLLAGIGGELTFDAQPDRLVAAVRGGKAQLGILMNPLDPADLFRVVQAGAVLPQKSTYFSPKIPSGLVIRDFR